jgi:hypothetical protein
MPRKSTRRVTLSSLEIENFLTEVSQDSSSRRRTISFDDVTNDFVNQSNVNERENVNPNSLNDVNKPPPVSTNSEAYYPCKKAVAINRESLSQEDMIRLYCKVIFLLFQ